MLKQIIQDAYVSRDQHEQILQAAHAESNLEKEKVSAELETAMGNPIFKIEKSHFKGTDTFIYDSTFQSLFGFPCFLLFIPLPTMYYPILIEKREGIWDRMILSPLRKWEMYVANLIYSFVMGYLQVLIIFFIFRFL